MVSLLEEINACIAHIRKIALNCHILESIFDWLSYQDCLFTEDYRILYKSLGHLTLFCRLIIPFISLHMKNFKIRGASLFQQIDGFHMKITG